ncbi:MarR family transcriptional regulator [Bacillus sp. 31A1R]|uniref:MarR family transcriptional regulator n=1 Tax=Robertmurraya mangrovi TaxID=3098077 RepID=A0ABU5J008_9BACI|nr:winged helix DNA-binding protein [Bacillus sp. 31A1R]MDZ5472721.1 MarR family transcriptional regulator [Bacillus sp. 31A1R]
MNSHDLFHSIHQLTRQLTKKLNEALEPYGLYSAQWSVLYTLKTKGTLTQRQLCDYLAVEAPPMTRTIQRLIKQDYVTQVQGDDRRTKYIKLTKKALQVYPEWENAVIKMNEQVINHFPLSSQEQYCKLTLDWLHSLEKI